MDIQSRQLITLLINSGAAPSQLIMDMAAHYHLQAQAQDQSTKIGMALYLRWREMEDLCKEAANKLRQENI
jgi:hypothetical protein